MVSKIRKLIRFIREFRAFVRELRELPSWIEQERKRQDREWRRWDAEQQHLQSVEVPALRRACQRALRKNPYMSFEEYQQVQPELQDYAPDTVH